MITNQIVDQRKNSCAKAAGVSIMGLGFDGDGWRNMAQRLTTAAKPRRDLNWLQRSFSVGVAVVVIWLVVLVSSGAAQVSSSVEDLQQQKQQIEQQRSRITQQQNQLRGLEGTAQSELKGLRKNIQVKVGEIQAHEVRLKTATAQLQTLEADLEKADRQYHQQQTATVARLRFLQRQQTNWGWAVLLQSQNMSEFLDRRRQLQRLYTQDQQEISHFRTASDRLARQRNRVEQQKNEIALLTQQLQAQKMDFEAQAQTQKATIARLKSDHQALEAAESQLAQDSQAVSSLIQQKIGIRSGIVFRGTGQFQIPSTGEVTSGFGWRMHPILGYERFHSGMDFGADYGSVIYAAESGVVIFAGWYGGYGNAAIIDHGSGLTTLYAHSSELYVVEGQSVQRGQGIAAIGSSGLSTGPHLHFEVRANGEPVDPAAYL
jgi:murein DD-endopeptidase MepM/ murein hydrolase activator NlpD